MRVPIVLPPGIFSDETSYASPGRWIDGNNMRPKGETMETIGGWTKVYSSALTGTCRNLHSWLDTGSLLNIAFGTHSKLSLLKNNTLYDITPSDLTAGNVDRGSLGYGRGGYGTGGYGGGPLTEFFPRTWSFGNWGRYLIANPRGRGIYVWQNNTGSLATKITQAPRNVTCCLVTPQRQILAFGCSEELSGSFNGMAIRGCDFEDYTDWTTAPDNNAFEHILEGGGRIVGARIIGTNIAIWTDTSVFLGTFIGDTAQTYRFDLIADNCGLAGPNAVTVINQVAYWLTPDLQFYAWSLGAAPVPLNCPIRTDFKDNIDTYHFDKVVCTSISEFNEVWWHYPDDRDTVSPDLSENSRYVAVNLDKGAWFRGQMARTAAIDSGPERYPVFVSPDSYAYYHEYGNDADGEALDWSIESGDFYLDEAQNRVFVRSVWPDFKDQVGNVSLTLKTKAYPQATAKTKGPWVLAPGREKRDMTLETRIAGIKASSSAVGAYARIGKPSFDVVMAGEN